MTRNLTCFKEYDVRGIIGKEFNERICYDIGRAFSEVLSVKKVVVGCDARATSEKFKDVIKKAVSDNGADVLDIGLCGTEEVYWATTEYNASGGIMVTASHNPINYNGLKFVKIGSSPLEIEEEFKRMKTLAEGGNFRRKKNLGKVIKIEYESKKKYCKKILSFVDLEKISKMKIVVNAGNGAAGPTFDYIAEELSKMTNKIYFYKIFHEPNSDFPNGVPNPLLEKNRLSTAEHIIKTGADFGIAFDGDFDRCFFFDDKGEFVPGEYVVSLLASVFLKRFPSEVIIHDNRIIWNSQEEISKLKGVPITSKTGHSYIKKAMRQNNAIYGGEMSAHHYFRDFAYCDSGMIPWLLVLEYLGKSNLSLSKAIKEMKEKFPSSGEMNFSVRNPQKVLKEIQDHFTGQYLELNLLDGLSLSFEKWRFNLRMSKTEPLLRLNVESKKNKTLLRNKVNEIVALISSLKNI